MRAIDAIRRSGISIEVDRSVHDAAVLMESAGVGALAVVDGDQLVGLVTDRDLVRRAMARGLAPDARVDGVMSTPVQVIDAGTDLHDAARAFGQKGVRRLAVTDGGRYVGMLSVDDLLIDLADDLASLARPIVAETLFAHHDAPTPATRDGG